MNHESYEIEYNEAQGVLYVRVLSTLRKEDIETIIPEMNRSLEGKAHRRILGDLSRQKTEDGMLDKGAREALKKHSGDANFDKIAVIGVGPMTRMIAKIGIAVSGKSNISQFFKTEEDALNWLKEV